MQHYHIHEAVHRSLHDFCNSNKPFGGLTIVFGGDFQQILLVIIKGSHAQVVGAYMHCSQFWAHIKVLHLTLNMCLDVSEQKE